MVVIDSVTYDINFPYYGGETLEEKLILGKKIPKFLYSQSITG